MLAFGLDPTSGARSAIGLCLISLETKEILFTRELKLAPTPDLRKRLKLLCHELAKAFKQAEEIALARNEDYNIFIESTVMMGKGGESLQRAIGAMLVLSPSHREVHHVSNMQIKAFVGGTGKADKREVAEGLKKYFPNCDTIFNLIASSRWDSTDAIAIAVTGMEKYVLQNEIKPQALRAAKPSKANKKSRST